MGTEIAEAISLNLGCGVTYLAGASAGPMGYKIMELHMCKNHVFASCPRCGAPASWVAWHITMYLDVIEVGIN